MSTPCCTLQFVAPADFDFLSSDPSLPQTTKNSQRPPHQQHHKRARRSGCIILNYETGKCLIIQSYHQYWGLPKGRVEENETHIQCAIRETYEETGIELTEQDFQKKFNIFNGDGTYFLVDGTELNFDESKICNKQEITGICWMCPACIRRNIRFQEMAINSHLRLLLPTIMKELNDHHHSILTPKELSDNLPPSSIGASLTPRVKKIESLSI